MAKVRGRAFFSEKAGLLGTAIGFLLMLTTLPLGAATPKETASQANDETAIPGPPVVHGTAATLTGAQTDIKHHAEQDPNDPTHAFDSTTRQDLQRDPGRLTWVNVKTGKAIAVDGRRVQANPPALAPTTQGTTQAPPSGAAPKENKTAATSGFIPTIQIRGFGGGSFINGNTPATAGFDGAVFFPLGNHALIGPSGGFQWISSSIVHAIGSQQPGSTFENTSVGFKNGTFGGHIEFQLLPGRKYVPNSSYAGWDIDVHAGATLAGSTITQQSGFCGLGNATSPAGCTVPSTTTTHDTVMGPFVGGYISHSIFPHVGVFVGYDYHLLKDTKSSTRVFNLHYSDVVAGSNLTFGRHVK